MNKTYMKHNLYPLCHANSFADRPHWIGGESHARSVSRPCGGPCPGGVAPRRRCLPNRFPSWLSSRPPAGEGATLLELLTERVPGCGRCDLCEGGFAFADVAKGEANSSLINAEEAVRLLGTMLGGYNIMPRWSFSTITTPSQPTPLPAPTPAHVRRLPTMWPSRRRMAYPCRSGAAHPGPKAGLRVGTIFRKRSRWWSSRSPVKQARTISRAGRLPVL